MAALSLDPRRLLIFREVGHAGSLSAAAQALGWSQPAVGQHVGRLERDTGLALVNRTSRGTTLTPAGRALLAHADSIADQVAAAVRAMAKLREQAADSLRLAACTTACRSLVPPLAARLRRLIPGFDLHLEQADAALAVALLQNGDADLALIAVPEDLSLTELVELEPGMAGQHVAADPLHALVPPDHSLGARARVEFAVGLEQLADQRWLVGTPVRQEYLARVFRTMGHEPQIRCVDGGDLMVRSMVASGMGVGLVSSLAGYGQSDDLVGLRLTPSPAQNIVAVYREDGSMPPVITQTVRQLRLMVPYTDARDSESA